MVEQVWMKSKFTLTGCDSNWAVCELCVGCCMFNKFSAVLSGCQHVLLNISACTPSLILSRNSVEYVGIRGTTLTSLSALDKHHCLERQGLCWELVDVYQHIGRRLAFSRSTSGRKNGTVTCTWSWKLGACICCISQRGYCLSLKCLWAAPSEWKDFWSHAW